VHCIAHRGFAGVNPENTLPAVHDAVERADGVEVDVRRCASGELVVCHDETVDRTTDGTGAVADHTAAELASLSVEGSDAGVPTLADVLAAVPPDVTRHAELKEQGLAADLEALAADAAPPVVASSFDVGALREVEELPTAFITSERAGALDRAASLGCRGVHPRTDVCDEGFVDRAHEAGLEVNAWTVTDPTETRRLREAGVDGVITDYPECCPDGL
jgi:glycerophosphoryl diester phosphodiesterase